MKKTNRSQLPPEQQPLFATSIPTLPRRQIIQPNLKNSRMFQDADDQINIRRKQNNKESTTHQEDYRHGKTTSQSFVDITQRKFQIVERRRAFFLFIIFFGILYMMSPGNDIEDNPYATTVKPHSLITSLFSLKKKKQDMIELDYNKEMNKKMAFREEKEEEEQPGLEHLYAVRNIRNMNEDLNKNDIPFYWHVPRCAGQTLKAILGECLDLVSACEVGVRDGHDQDVTLDIVGYKGARYVNVDTSTLEGIERARDMSLVNSAFVHPDVIMSNFILPISQEIYNKEHKARAFALLRHPIDRAVSMYHFGQKSGIIPKEITITEYAQGQGIENNHMVRYITNKLQGDLPPDALFEAKIILKKKFLIGFVDDLHESITRFINYNKWSYDGYDSKKAHQQEQCVNMLVDVGTNRNKDEYEVPKKGSHIYSLIAWQNSHDVKLYEYAKELFNVQTKLWGSKERKKADKKKKRLSSG